MSVAGADLGMGGGGCSLEAPKLRLKNTLTCPENAGNPLSQSFHFNFFHGEDAPGTPTGDPLRQSVSPTSSSVSAPE